MQSKQKYGRLPKPQEHESLINVNPQGENGVSLNTFPSAFIKGHKSSKTDQRRVVSDYATMWIEHMHSVGVPGCIVFDIDDTLIDGNQSVRWGFEFMVTLYNRFFHKYPVHVVTARPNDDHDRVTNLLKDKGMHLSPDRLHMMPYKEWGDEKLVEKFKWDCHEKISAEHGGVIAKFGDKLWDVAHIKSLRGDPRKGEGYLSHVTNKDCFIFFDPKLGKFTLSVKLPGA